MRREDKFVEKGIRYATLALARRSRSSSDTANPPFLARAPRLSDDGTALPLLACISSHLSFSTDTPPRSNLDRLLQPSILHLPIPILVPVPLRLHLATPVAPLARARDLSTHTYQQTTP